MANGAGCADCGCNLRTITRKTLMRKTEKRIRKVFVIREKLIEFCCLHTIEKKK